MKPTEATGRGAALLITTLTSFVTPFMASAVNIALPTVGREFGMDAVLLSWVATSYILAAAMFLVPFGRLADIHGRKRVFVMGLGVFSLACLLISLSRSAAVLIALRVLQGVGATMTFGTSIAVLTSVFPPGERGKAIGITSAAVYLGLSLGPFLGGLITQHLGWRIIFLINVPLSLLILLLTVWKLKGEWAEARGEAFDWTGSAIYGLALVAIMYGFSRLPGVSGAALVACGLAGVVLFWRWVNRAKSPVLDARLFRGNPGFTLSNLAALINYCATFAVTFLLSLYLQYIKGLSPGQAGAILVAQPVVMAAVSPLAGRLSDRIEPRIVASLGMALTTLGLGLLILLGRSTATPYVVACLIVLGLGFGLFASPNTNAVMASVERRFYGVASAALGTMRLTGQMLSMGTATLIFALFIGRVQITPEHYPLFLAGTRTAFGLFAGLCLLGTFVSLARGKIRS
jgi:EmrB/QacA subfamily drug resistance transporter